MMLSKHVRSALAFVLLVLLIACPALAQTDPHEGRGSFLIQQIPLGIWYGVGMSSFLTNDNSDTKTTVTIGLLSASAFYFGPMILTWNRPISNAQAHEAVAFGYRGIGAGFALGDVFNVGRERSPYGGYDYNSRPRMGLMVATSLGSQVGGYFLARPMSLGQATLTTAYSDFGQVDGLLICAAVMDGDDGRHEVRVSPYYLGGLALGTAAGWYRQQTWDCTEGQVTFLRTAGFLGAAVTGAVVNVVSGVPFEDNDSGDHDHFTWLCPLMVAGNIVSVYAGEQVIKDAPLTNNEGLICLGTTVAGGLLGSGLGYLVTDEARTHWERPIIGLGAAGAIGGLYLGLRLAPSYTQHAATGIRRDALARVNLDFGALAAGIVTYSQSRTFSAPRLLTMEF